MRCIDNQQWNLRRINNLPMFEKYLYVYLQSSPETNMYGVFLLVSNVVISDRTGMNIETVEQCLQQLESKGLISIVDDHIILHGYYDKQASNKSHTWLKGYENFRDTLPQNVLDEWDNPHQTHKATRETPQHIEKAVEVTPKPQVAVEATVREETLTTTETEQCVEELPLEPTKDTALVDHLLIENKTYTQSVYENEPTIEPLIPELVSPHAMSLMRKKLRHKEFENQCAFELANYIIPLTNTVWKTRYRLKPTFRELFGNYLYWRELYEFDDICKAIRKAPYNDFLKDKLHLRLLFRQTDTKRVLVDRISDCLNTPPEDANLPRDLDFDESFIKSARNTLLRAPEEINEPSIFIRYPELIPEFRDIYDKVKPSDNAY